jgi:hypothetical protein
MELSSWHIVRTVLVFFLVQEYLKASPGLRSLVVL